jgi:hypothetical protein
MTKRHCAAFMLLAGLCLAAQAGPGEAFVPAHRSKDGSLVPANVPPLSGGTHMTRRPGKAGVKAHRIVDQRRTALMPPLFAEARPARR